MISTATTFAILAAIIVLFVSDRVPVVLVAIGTAPRAVLYRRAQCRPVAPRFWRPPVIFIASLFVVSAGLDASGVTAWAGQGLISRAGQSRARLLVLTMLLVALLTALISINGAVAALLPVVIVMAIRVQRSPSQLLMPLVFAAHSGSLLALTGTPVNVLVAEAAADAGLAPFDSSRSPLSVSPCCWGPSRSWCCSGSVCCRNAVDGRIPARPQQARPDAGRAIQVGRWDVPAARAVAFALRRFAAGCRQSGGICGPDAGYHPRRRRRTAAETCARRGRRSHRQG